MRSELGDVAIGVQARIGEAIASEAAGNRVRQAREHRLMTQAELAEKAQVALRTIHSVEKGMNCRLDTKRKILTALEYPFEERDQVFPPGAEVRVRRPRSPRG